jgi:tetrathionate reductase subunit C
VRIVAIAAAVAAVFVLLYTGAEVAVIKSRPLWNSPLLPLQFVFTAFAGATGLALVLNHAMGTDDKAAERRLNHLLAVFLVAVILIGLAWLAFALSGVSTHAAALDALSGLPVWKAIVWAIALTVAPLILILIKPSANGWLTGVVALFTAWMFRWAVFMGVQAVPKTGAGLLDYDLPFGPEGWLGILGTAGLWLFLMIMITTFVPWQGTAADAPPPRDTNRGGPRPMTKGA